MKHINLDSSSSLERFKKHMIESIDKELASVKVEERLSSLSEQPLGTLKNLFESISGELFDSKEGRNIIKRFINTIKEYKDVRDEYVILENVSNPKYVSDASDYVMAMFNGYSVRTDRLNECKKKLSEIIAEGVKLCGIDSDTIDSVTNENKSLNESVEYLLSTKKTLSNLHEYTNKLSNVRKFVESRMPEGKDEIDENVKSLSESLENLFEDNGLETWENRAIKDIALSCLSESAKQDLFEKYRQDCVNVLEESLSDKDINIEDKTRLSSMKEQLNFKKYSEDTLSEDILMLSKLMHTLSE